MRALQASAPPSLAITTYYTQDYPDTDISKSKHSAGGLKRTWSGSLVATATPRAGRLIAKATPWAGLGGAATRSSHTMISLSYATRVRSKFYEGYEG